MTLPDYEPGKLNTGQYKFIIADYKIRKHQRERGVSTVIEFQFKAQPLGIEDASYRVHFESIGAWEDRYRDLKYAIGATKGADGLPHLTETLEIIGASFKASIIHEKDKNDSNKSYARIADVQIPEDIETGNTPPPDDEIPPPSNNIEDDEVPF
jgi:hypothetical protein